MSPSITKTLIKFRRRIGIPTTLPRNPSLPPTFPPFSSSCSFSSSGRALCSLAESPLISSSQPQVKEGRRWSRWLLFLPGAITFGLGTWQIFRRQDKIEMLEHRRKRLELEPLLWNTLSSSSSLYGDLSSLEFRRVMFDGVFDASKSIYIGPRSRSISGVTENGYYVVTPLIPFADNRESLQSPVLVNRGWVPRSWRDKSLENFQNSEQPSNIPSHDDKQRNEKEGSSWWRFWSKKPNNIKDQPLAIMPVKVIGVVRGSEKPSIFVPENDPSSGQWFYIDVPAIARACGLPGNTIYIEDINENINPSKPYPIPKDINSLIRSSVMPQDHLNYTLTWYSLSAAVTFMAVKRLKPIKSRR